MTEAQFTTKFQHWLKRNFHFTCAYECKVTNGNSLPFKAVKDHQELALKATSERKLTYKIPDDSRGVKPFDGFMLVNEMAFVVIRFNTKDRGNKDFYMVPVDVWERIKQTAQRRSVTKEMIGEYKFVL